MSLSFEHGTRIVEALERIAAELQTFNESFDLVASDYELRGNSTQGTKVTLLDAVLRISAELAEIKGDQ